MPIKFREISLIAGELRIKPLPEDMDLAMALVRKHKNMVYDLSVKEHREKRSLDANAFSWVLLGKLAEAMHMKTIEVYRNAIKDLGGNYTPVCLPEKEIPRFIKMWEHNGLGWVCDDLGANTVPGCHTILAYHGSSTFDTKTMSRFLENIIQDCKALGIETLSPEKLAMMEEEWK